MVSKTVQELLKEGLGIIQERDYCNPSLDVQLILSYLLNCSRVHLIMNRDTKVEPEICAQFYEMANKRNEGYPLQYMTHTQEFMGHIFFVQEGVLVPRPDTEILTELAIKAVKKHTENENTAYVLDIGTGSGAVALSIAYSTPKCRVSAVDISSIAVETANINKKRLELENVDIIKGDIFGNLNTGNRKYHVVVSNPPYIETHVIEGLQAEVAHHEPKLALDGGADGLDYYRRIAAVFKDICTKSAALLTEIGCDQGQAVSEIYQSAGIFAEIAVHKDLENRDRVVSGFL